MPNNTPTTLQEISKNEKAILGNITQKYTLAHSVKFNKKSNKLDEKHFSLFNQSGNNRVFAMQINGTKPTKNK